MQTEGAVEVRADIPGVSKDDINVRPPPPNAVNKPCIIFYCALFICWHTCGIAAYDIPLGCYWNVLEHVVALRLMYDAAPV